MAAAADAAVRAEDLAPEALAEVGGPGGMMGPTSTGRRFNLTFSAQALNLFNNMTSTDGRHPTPIGTGWDRAQL